MFLVVKIKKNIQSMYQKNVVKKNFDILLIAEEGTMFLSKILIRLCMIIIYIVEENIFAVIVCKLTLHLIANKELKYLKKASLLNSKFMKKKKIKLPFIIYADFESILVPEDNGKQNPEESYTNKYQKHTACSYGYELVCVDDKFSNPFKTYLGEDAAYDFINNMIEEIL